MKRHLPIVYIVFLCLLLMPLYGRFYDKRFALQGVSSAAGAPQITAKGLIDGTTQSQVAGYWDEKMPGRNLLIRTHNQILYSAMKTPPNANIIMTGDKVLFEPSYVEYSLGYREPMTDGEVTDLIDKLQLVRNKIEASGKQLFIFVTPSKARYVEAPFVYRKLLSEKNDKNAAENYRRFIEQAKTTDLKVYDSIPFIESISDSFPYPMWYKGGIHWSNVLGNTVAADFVSWIAANSDYDLTQLAVEAVPCEEPVQPDSDLLDTLNLFRGEEEQYYEPVITVTHQGTDTPSVFYRGGSFMGQSLMMLVRHQVFVHDAHLENNYMFTDNYSTKQTVSSFDAYEEYEDLPEVFADKEIVILEVNESEFERMSFGFIDYLLEQDF